MSQIIVNLQDVSKKFNNKESISNISFEIHQGEITTLIGPNGAGKTTIAKLVLGLEKPTSGAITIVPNLKIGYVPQSIELNRDLPMNAEQFMLLFAPDYMNNDKISLLDFINFANIKNKAITALSGGILQKLMLAAVLLSKPELVILDEPTKSMDLTSQQEFYKLIERARKAYNLTIFMISHDLLTVIKNSDQVICLNGHICCSGRPNNSLQEQENFMRKLSSIGFYLHHHDHRH